MRVPLTFLAASLLLANAGHASATDTRIPDATVKAAEQLRDKALTDDTGYKIVTSLTTEVGPRIAGGVNDARAAPGRSPSSRRWVTTRSIPRR
jgi:hypothetical protein